MLPDPAFIVNFCRDLPPDSQINGSTLCTMLAFMRNSSELIMTVIVMLLSVSYSRRGAVLCCSVVCDQSALGCVSTPRILLHETEPSNKRSCLRTPMRTHFFVSSVIIYQVILMYDSVILCKNRLLVISNLLRLQRV